MKTAHVPLPTEANRFWKFLHYLGRFVLRPALCHLYIEGTENMPKEGGLVIACNHTMGPDYAVLGYASPRQVYYMAKSEIFDVHPWLTKFLWGVGTFPVERGRRDQGALIEAVELVESGRVLGMFPEGTRSRSGALQSGKSGTVRIAMKAQVPVLPVIVLGSDLLFRRSLKRWRRPHVTVRMGQPIPMQGDLSDSVAVKDNTHTIMVEMAKLLPSELRGEYAEVVKGS